MHKEKYVTHPLAPSLYDREGRNPKEEG